MTHNQFQRKDAPFPKSIYVVFFSSVFDSRLRKFKISLADNRFTSPWVPTNFLCKAMHSREDVRGGASMEQTACQHSHNNLILNVSFTRLNISTFENQTNSLWQSARMCFHSIPIAANAGLPTAALRDDDAASAALKIETIRSQLRNYQEEVKHFDFWRPDELLAAIS